MQQHLVTLILGVVFVDCFALSRTLGATWHLSAEVRGGALEVDATSEVVGGTGRIGSLFLREEGAIAVPRGVAPGCLATRSTIAPIIVAVPSRDWKAIFNTTLPHRRSDLVWIGNGLLSDWQRNSSVVLPHFGVLQVGADPVTSPESPPTYVFGKHAYAMAAVLTKRGIQVVSVIESWTEMRKLAAQKLLWASCLWLLCHDSDPTPLTVSEVHERKQQEVERLVKELLPSLRSLTGSGDVDSEILLEEALSYMKAYSLSMPQAIPSIALAMAELHDRNGVWFGHGGSEQSFHIELLERVAGKEAIAVLLQQSTNQSDEIESMAPPKLVPIPAIDLVCYGELTDDNRAAPTAIKSAIIVGGGIIGSSIARALVERGVKQVTVYDPTISGKTTPASWAWLNANQKFPPSYKSLNQLGMRGWRSDSLLKELPGWTGALVCTNKTMESNGGYTSEGPLSIERIRELEPEANFTTRGHVYYFADEGYVDPHEAVRTLRQAAIDQGVSFVGNELIVGLVRNNEGRVIGVKATNLGRETERFADVVVVAAGVNAADKVLGGLPLVPSPGRISFARSPSSSLFSPPATTLSRILVDVIRESHILQRKDGTFAVGGGALEVGGSSASDRAQLTSKEGQKLMVLARELAPNPIGGSVFTHSEEAVRPMPQDGLPICGYQDAGLYTVVTHSGVTMAPILGQLVAAELKERVSLSILNEYRPDRFE